MTQPSGVRLAASERKEEWGLVVSDCAVKFSGGKRFPRGMRGWADAGPVGPAGWAESYSIFLI